MDEETSVTELLGDDAFSAAFDSFVEPKEGDATRSAEAATDDADETDEAKAAATDEAKAREEAEAAEAKAAEELKAAEEAAKAAPPPAASAAEIAKAIAEALKPAEPEKKPEAPAAEEEDSPEVKEALADLEKNWGSHALAINTLLEKQAKSLKAEFAKILEPLQAQIAPVVAATAAQTQVQFETALKAAHPDAYEIIPAVEAWIEKQPAYLRPAMNHVLDHGSAAEVAEFLTDFKTATGKTVDPAVKAAAEKAEAERLAKLKKMEPPTGSRTSVTTEPDPQDFESAWDAASKKVAA